MNRLTTFGFESSYYPCYHGYNVPLGIASQSPILSTHPDVVNVAQDLPSIFPLQSRLKCMLLHPCPSGQVAGTLEVSEDTHIIFMLASIVIIYFGAVVPTWALFLRVAVSTQERTSIKSAWQRFPWAARLQFFKLLGEVFVLETGVCILLFIFVLAHSPLELHDVLQFFVKYFG